MNGNAYKLLGFLVWKGGKWYLSRRLPSPRRVLLRGLLAVALLAIAGLLAKRALG